MNEPEEFKGGGGWWWWNLAGLGRWCLRALYWQRVGGRAN